MFCCCCLFCTIYYAMSLAIIHWFLWWFTRFISLNVALQILSFHFQIFNQLELIFHYFLLVFFSLRKARTVVHTTYTVLLFNKWHHQGVYRKTFNNKVSFCSPAKFQNSLNNKSFPFSINLFRTILPCYIVVIKKICNIDCFVVVFGSPL